MKTQAEAANFHPDCFHQFRFSRLGNKNVVDELFERHFSQIMYRSEDAGVTIRDRKSTRLNSSHDQISYAVFCLKKKKNTIEKNSMQPQLHVSEETSRQTI